jgi:hypothetical protein
MKETQRFVITKAEALTVSFSFSFAKTGLA